MARTVELYFQRTGAGAPLVILHGLFGSSRNWQTIAGKLANAFSVTTVDLRNHGSSPHATKMDYAAQRDDLSRLLEKLELQDVTLIGHSMGGKAAMTLALSEPERIARLVVVDIAPGAYVNEYGPMLDAMKQLDLSSTTRRTDAQSQLRSAIPDGKIRSFILQNLRFSAHAPPEWRINLEAIRNNIDKLVGAIPCGGEASFAGPTYFIRGFNSDRIADSDLTSIVKHFPDYHLIDIANAGHWPHAENPAEFLSELKLLLSGAHEETNTRADLA